MSRVKRHCRDDFGSPAIFWSFVLVLILLGLTFAALVAVVFAVWFKVI
jgi:hypothetical protein